MRTMPLRQEAEDGVGAGGDRRGRMAAMKISELIAELEKAMAEHGDMPVHR